MRLKTYHLILRRRVTQPILATSKPAAIAQARASGLTPIGIKGSQG